MKPKNIQIHQDPEITWSSSLRMPFSVPEGYFDQFQEYLMSAIQMTGLPKEHPFSVPSEQYFQEFTTNLMSEIKLKENNSSILPHEVPDGYFEGFADQLLEQLNEHSVDAALNRSKQMPHEIPNEYFTHFPKRILNFAKAIESDVEQENKSKTVPIHKTPVRKQWLWMVASITLLLGFLGVKNKDLLFNTAQPAFDEAYFESEIAKIPYEEIQDYFNIHDEKIELNFSSRDSEQRFMEGLNKISLDDLENYLGATN